MGAFGGAFFVMAIIFMVMFHEFGHYIWAKRFDMKVTEFFFGFGPRLWSVRRGETDYGIKPIPLGGYVKIVGMNPLEEIPPQEESRTFRGKPPWQKLIVLVAGSTTHFITGLFLLVIVFAGVGIPGDPVPVLADVPHQEGVASPAETAGLRRGDRIVSVDGREVTTWEEVSDFIASRPNDTVTFGIEREGRRLNVSATLTTRDDGRGFLGVVADQATERDALPVAVWHSFRSFGDITYSGLKGLFGFFAPSSLSRYLQQLAGQHPAGEENRVVSVVGAVGISSKVQELGTYLFFIAAVNIFVGVVNLLPLHPLDGGWVAVTLYEKAASKLRRRRVTVDFRKLVPLTYAVVAVMLFLFVTSIYLDITSPIKLNL